MALHRGRRWKARKVWLRLLFEEQEGRCCFCRRKMVLVERAPGDDMRTTSDEATLEHLVPVSLGGSPDKRENLAVSCSNCNQKRHKPGWKPSKRCVICDAEIPFFAKNYDDPTGQCRRCHWEVNRWKEETACS